MMTVTARWMRDWGRPPVGWGACQRTVDTCVNGQVQTCVPGTPAPAEICNNSTDDDCDGVVDNPAVCNNPLPPDPSTVAPALDLSAATTIGAATEFLYTGTNPIQTGVAPGTIEPQRVAVLRGRVLDRAGAPVPAVQITVLGHPEFGQTLSRADGRFDLAVNGGGMLTLSYEKQGYPPAQRTRTLPWQDFVMVPDVVLVRYDDRVTRIDLAAAVPIQVARGNAVTDSSGTRQATLLFPQGTTATMTLPNGTTQPLTVLNVRATEFTVGPAGPSTMPAVLPSTSAYTYAAEFSVDEAVAAGATAVTFGSPVVFYLENFVNIPVGQNAPVGFYDRARAQWVPEPNGRVIKILSITGGLANLDTNGDGVADDDATLQQLGITSAERQQLASLYAANHQLWRVPLNHFSPGDINYPSNPPADGKFANQPKPKSDPKLDDPCHRNGSVIECQNQIVGEALGLTGVPFSLHYMSDRVPGRTAANVSTIPLSGASVPASLQHIDLEVAVAGQHFTQSFPPQPNQTATFTWDGRDAYGRAVQGVQLATVRIGYAYLGTYQQPPSFPQSFGLASGIGFAGLGARAEVILIQEQQVAIGAWDARASGLGRLDAERAPRV